MLEDPDNGELLVNPCDRCQRFSAVERSIEVEAKGMIGDEQEQGADRTLRFNPGQEFHRESQILERHGKGRPFQWKAEWRDAVEGLLEIENAFRSNAKLRWVSFETRPGP